MRKTIFKAAIAAMVIVLSSSNISAKAAEEGYYESGFTSEITDIVWDEPAKEEPKKEEPKQEEPKEEPKKEEPKQEEPKEEPKKEEPKQEEPKEEPKQEQPKQEEPKEEPKQEQPKEEPKQEPKKDEPKQEPKKEKQDDSKKEEPKKDTPVQKQQDEPSNDTPVKETPVNNNNEQAPVVKEEKKADDKPAVDASAVTRAVRSAAKKTVVAPKEDTVVEPVETTTVEEMPVKAKTVESNDSNMLLYLLALLLFVLLLLLMLLLALRMKYSVVCIRKKNGDVEETVIKRFASFKKACEFVDDYDWHRSDAELRIINTRQKNEEVRVGGKKINKSIVYFVNNGKTIEGSDYCSEKEASVMEDVLGFVVECF